MERRGNAEHHPRRGTMRSGVVRGWEIRDRDLLGLAHC